MELHLHLPPLYLHSSPALKNHSDLSFVLCLKYYFPAQAPPVLSYIQIYHLLHKNNLHNPVPL